MNEEDWQPRPTSFDVARAAGVSRSTVSRAFTEGSRISPEVRDLVLRTAETLDYRINALARGLQVSHSNLVGIVASRLDTPFRALQVRIIAQSLLREGMNPILLVADGGEDVQALIQNVLTYNVAGVIVTSDSPPPEVMLACRRAGTAVVLINRGPSASDADTVNMDVAAGGRAAFGMLRDSGVRRFGLLAPFQQTYSVTGRADAFLACCREAGVPVTVVRSDGQSHAAGRAAAEAIGRQTATGNIEGVFCATDLLALGVLDKLRHEDGVAIPASVQLVGFDDIEPAAWGAYGLSTIRQDVAAQARAAVDLMLLRLQSPDRAFETRQFDLVKVYRTTTLAPADPTRPPIKDPNL